MLFNINKTKCQPKLFKWRYSKYQAPISKARYAALGLIFLSLCIGCKKSVEIPPPANSITTSQVFADSSDAAASIAGIYSKILYRTGGSSRDIGSCNGVETIYCGISADELRRFITGGDPTQFYLNTLLSTNGTVFIYLWQKPYSIIYQANACIEGLQASTTISTTVKNEFVGEAKFLRSLSYFYLVNLFGDIPYVNSTVWAHTATTSRTPKEQVYQNIIADLKDAQKLLLPDYSFSGNQRTRANQSAATALLARAYLYSGDWVNAEAQATAIINNTSNFGLAANLNDVFLATSNEAILQWQLNTGFGAFDATAEGYNILPPADGSLPPAYYISPQLLNAFEPGDQRKTAWIGSSTYSGTTYFYPNKYKIGRSQAVGNSTPSEYYTVLRVAEQYLIRAEARAQQNNLSDAINDLNAVRTRAGLPNLSISLTQTEVLAAVAQERRIELFAEWGHRWLDLKRTGQIDNVMSVVTPQKNGGGVWNSHQQLYPIPQVELTLDPNLTQNQGY